MTSVSRSAIVTRRNVRWMVILLAIIVADLVGIVFTLAEERRINASFQSAVTSNLESNSRASAIQELSSLAVRVGATGDLTPQRAQETARFFAQLNELRGRSRKSSAGGDADWSRGVEQVDAEMRSAIEESALMFSLSGTGNLIGVEAHLKELRRHRNAVGTSLNELADKMLNDELSNVHQMADVMPALSRLQNIFAILIVVLLLVISGGFYRVATQIMSSRRRDLSEERLKLATNATTDVIWDWPVDEDRLWCNERFAALTGQPLAKDGTVAVNTWYAGIHPDDLERVKESLATALSGGGNIWSEEYRLASHKSRRRVAGIDVCEDTGGGRAGILRTPAPNSRRGR